jgi:hypothetical protein
MSFTSITPLLGNFANSRTVLFESIQENFKILMNHLSNEKRYLKKLREKFSIPIEIIPVISSANGCFLARYKYEGQDSSRQTSKIQEMYKVFGEC